jgi:large subunit ribosomal protein L6
MKTKISETLEIPSGISCEYSKGVLQCSKDSVTLKRNLSLPRIKITVQGNSILLESDKANRNENKYIKTFKAHILNLFSGLNEKFSYRLEAVNVHFPMTLKLDGNTLLINNFLGEKIPRKAKIISNVHVDLKGNVITVTSHDKDAAGQTAGNIEKATRVKGYDRRVFQDGIYITQKPGDEK